MADRHSGCFVCGGGQGAILISIPDMSSMTSVALCASCHALPNAQLRSKLDAVHAAVKAAREAARNG